MDELPLSTRELKTAPVRGDSYKTEFELGIKNNNSSKKKPKKARPNLHLDIPTREGNWLKTRHAVSPTTPDVVPATELLNVTQSGEDLHREHERSAGGRSFTPYATQQSVQDPEQGLVSDNKNSDKATKNKTRTCKWSKWLYFLGFVVLAIAVSILSVFLILHIRHHDVTIPSFTTGRQKGFNVYNIPEHSATSSAALLYLTSLEGDNSRSFESNEDRPKEGISHGKGMEPLLGWSNEVEAAFVSKGFEFNPDQGRVKVLEPGLYKVSCQITSHAPQHYNGMVFSVRLYSYNDKYKSKTVLLEDTQLAYCPDTETTSPCHSSFVSAPVKLRKGDELYVAVNHPELVVRETKSTYFGINSM